MECPLHCCCSATLCCPAADNLGFHQGRPLAAVVIFRSAPATRPCSHAQQFAARVALAGSSLTPVKALLRAAKPTCASLLPHESVLQPHDSVCTPFHTGPPHLLLQVLPGISQRAELSGPPLLSAAWHARQQDGLGLAPLLAVVLGQPVTLPYKPEDIT